MEVTFPHKRSASNLKRQPWQGTVWNLDEYPTLQPEKMAYCGTQVLKNEGRICIQNGKIKSIPACSK